MPALINGSPTHALIVHAVVVLLPLSVVAALLLVAVPATRRAFGLVTVGITFLACIAVPLAFVSGSSLRRRVPPSPLVDHHVALAHQLLPVAALFGLSVAGFVAVDLVRRARHDQLNQVEVGLLARRRHQLGTPAAGSLSTAYRVSAVLLVLTAVLTAVAVVRVGDSGAKAVWHGRVATSQSVR